jgi:hypothetical protein
MKNLIAIAAAFILATGFTTINQKTTLSDSYEKNFYTGSFTRIVVEDDIDLTLVESTEKTIELSGADEDLEKVDWQIKGGILYLKTKHGLLSEKLLVTLSVKGLKEIEVNGTSTVKSLGNIQSANLYIYMNGMGRVNITNAGKIFLVHGEGIDLDIKKKTANVSIMVK